MQNGYSICFNEWALDKSIKSELGLLLIISSLTRENGFCTEDDKYFAELFDESLIQIKNQMVVLTRKNYINMNFDNNHNREIRIVGL